MNTLQTLTLFFPFFVSLFWAVTLLCNLKRNTRQQNIWIAFLVLFGIASLVWSVLFNVIEDYSIYYKLDVVDISLTLTFFPVIFLYFRPLTGRKGFAWKRYAWLVPGIVIGACSAVLYALMGEQRSAVYIKEVIENFENIHFEVMSLEWWLCLVSVYLLSAVLFIQAVSVMIYSTMNLRRYKRGLSNFFSNFDEKSIENNRAVLVGLFVLLGLAPVMIVMWTIASDLYMNMGYLIVAISGVIIYYMSYHVSRISKVEEEFVPDPVSEIEIVSQAEIKALCVKMLPSLVEIIDGQRIFLQPNLSLNDIALRLNSNRTYVSQIINTEFQSSFYDFINRKRIDYARELIVRNPSLSQEQTAESSGFISGSTFSRVFKKQTGQTFREWRKGVIENN